MRDLGATRIVLEGVDVTFPAPSITRASTVPDGQHSTGTVEVEDDDGIPLGSDSVKRGPELKPPDLSDWFQSQPPPTYAVEG